MANFHETFLSGANIDFVEGDVLDHIRPVHVPMNARPAARTRHRPTDP